MSAEANGYVYSGRLTREALAELLARLFPSGYAVVRSVEDLRFDTFVSGDAVQLVAGWKDGRVFDERCEVRWLKKDKNYAVLLLTESEPVEASTPHDLKRSDDSPLIVAHPSAMDDHGFLLWGTHPNRMSHDPRQGHHPPPGGREQKYWWEARIPRPLSYPLQTDRQPPRLTYCLYLDGAAVRFARLTGLKEARQDAGHEPR